VKVQLDRGANLTDGILRKSRRRFVLWFFVVGACAPVLWIGIGYALRFESISSSLVGALLFVASCATFPTQILFLDAEHLPELIFMLLIAMPVNGAWFGVVGLGLWYLREALPWLRRKAIRFQSKS
jgi:hypothetical protein